MSLTNLPSFSVEQTATSSDSQAHTAISSGVTESPAVFSSAETLSADNANLLSMTDPEPLTEMDSMTTDTNTLSGSTAKPAFALHQPTVAGLLVSAYYSDWSPLPSLLKILT